MRKARLDYNFDVLIDDREVRILNVAGFEIVGALQNEIRAIAAQNIQDLQGCIAVCRN